MTIGFSIYNALVPFAGQFKTGFSADEVASLFEIVLHALRNVDDNSVMLRMPGISTQGLRGFVFLTESEGTGREGALTVCALSETDILANELFIISNSADLPILAIAQWTMSGFDVLVSIDPSLIDIARTIVAQYDYRTLQMITPSLSGYWAAGQLVVEIAAHFGADLISSWVTHALTAPPQQRLASLRQALGAQYCAYGDLESGEKPGNQRGTSTIRVEPPDADSFVAVGPATDGNFEARCWVAAGVMGATALPTAEAPATTETTSQFREVDFSALSEEFFSNWPELDEDASSDVAPATTSPQTASNGSQGSRVEPSASTLPGASMRETDLEVLSYINHEITFLRDRIMDAGLYRSLDPQPREVLDHFIERSGDLVLLLDELVYLQQMIDVVKSAATWLNPYEMLNAIVLTYAGEAERRGVDLRYDVPDTLPDVRGDAEALNRALVIVLEQAIEHAAPHGAVMIGARRVDDWLEVFVKDSGPPLTKSAIEQLFVPRFQVQSGTPHLGFAALKPIIGIHGGEVIVEGTSNGNKLGFRLPIEHTNPQ